MTTLALDLTRLAVGPVRFAPRGIDRVELAYARHFLHRWPGDCLAVLPTIWGVRCFERERALRGIAALETLWQEAAVEPWHDSVYVRTKSFLAGDAVEASQGKQLTPTILKQTQGFLRLLRATRFSFGRAIARALPVRSIYLNVGQLGLFRPALTWLHRRPDVRGVFMIHDVIPLEFPEHHLPIGIRMHKAIMRNAAEFASALIVPSHAAAVSVRRRLEPSHRTDAPIHVEHLPVPSEFLQPMTADRDLAGRDYFVICGTIDSYKNHLLMLRIWSELVERRGRQAPKLVIAGSPGVTGHKVLQFLAEHPAISGHVMIASGLSTAGLRQLMGNARALLMPSLAEGFGLPIVEALAQGTLVLASDIAAHREAGQGGAVTYIPAEDVTQWRFQIEQLAGAAMGRKLSKYSPKTWNEYFSGVESFLQATGDRGPGNP